VSGISLSGAECFAYFIQFDCLFRGLSECGNEKGEDVLKCQISICNAARAYGEAAVKEYDCNFSGINQWEPYKSAVEKVCKPIWILGDLRKK